MSTHDDETFKSLAIVFIIVIIFAVASLSKGCTNETDARSTLEASGFTDIKIGGYEFGACHDYTCTGFTAIGPSGKKVRGAVGCGWYFAGCTVRVMP
jgi:hypothetical protein